ncbi:D-alanyl-D-alanine carboxypeptidase family protein [Neomoorella thermoacetica]|uniref:D-alanyl-D-alanine carboxypeptidase family protein n=1 Tax=Neomoorella thermoacetica TaxID=1525 RepID=UPI0030CC3149
MFKKYGPRFLAAGVFLFIFLSFIKPGRAAAPDIQAESYVLMDFRTGQVLMAKNPHERRPQASTTKITTAILALERGNLNDQVIASKNAAETPESSIYLQEGETLTLEELLYALLLRSANDAAVAIAEHIGGSVENFARMMNAKVQEIGARDTHYVNPHGLTAPDHYSSAYDLALIGRYAMMNPKFREIVSTRRRIIPWAGKPWPRLLINENRLLWGYYAYPGADGVKNGYTTPAGQVLVASATRDNWRLIAVVMKSPNMYRETSAILDYGFNNFHQVKLMPAGQQVALAGVRGGIAANIPAVTADDVLVVEPKNETWTWQQRVELNPDLNAPVKKGDRIGRIIFTSHDQEVSVDLIAAGDVAPRPWWMGFLEAFLTVFNLPWLRF